MSLRRVAVVVVGLFCGLIVVPALWAAVISGTIESVSADRKKITVKLSGDKPKQVFSIPDGASITLDGKTAKLGDLKEGQPVSVTSSGDAVTRVCVRSGETKSTTPATSPASKTTSKTKKTETADSSNEDASGGKPSDSPQFRGPRRDGHAGSGNNIANSWPPSGPKPAWSASNLGSGYAAVSVANGRIYSMGLIGNDEKVFALNERDGRQAWAVSTGGDAFHEGQGDGPRCTPTVDGDRLYAMGCFGDLVCLDAKSGRRHWHKNVLKEFGFRNKTIQWGICESPLIDGDKLIVTPGAPGATMVALNKNNGSTIWKSRVPGDPGPAYASAIAVDVGGVRQYVNFTGRGLIGVRADDGEFFGRTVPARTARRIVRLQCSLRTRSSMPPVTGPAERVCGSNRTATPRGPKKSIKPKT